MKVDQSLCNYNFWITEEEVSFKKLKPGLQGTTTARQGSSHAAKLVIATCIAPYISKVKSNKTKKILLIKRLLPFNCETILSL